MHPAFHFHTSRTEISAGAWSVPDAAPAFLLRAEQDISRLYDLNKNRCVRSWHDPLECLAWLSEFTLPGRWIGYLSYDLAYLFESIGSNPRDDLRFPLFAFAFFPHTSEKFLTPSPGIPACGEQSRTGEGRGEGISAFSVQRSAFLNGLLPEYRERRQDCEANFTREEYERAVEQAKNFIAAGDVFQINLAQRFTIPTSLTSQEIHNNLLRDSPAAYGALLDFGDFALISNSPELFLRVDPHPGGSRRILTRPIKGTRPRLPGMERALRDSVKDQAELNMIIDLERNDLGRVCEIGSVRVTQPRTIEAHPTLYHGVASIAGNLRSNINFLDILKAAFPGGSVTGAPKIRAMQLIHQLEPCARGPYCGAIGYLDSDGSMQFNLAIRTIVLKDGHAHVSVGGGIVADSVPADEYAETLVKAQAMFRALKVRGMTKFE